MPLEIKNYRDLGDLRRDLALLEKEIDHSITQVHHYLHVLSNLQVISANVRGNGVSPELQRVVQPVLPLTDMAKNIAVLSALQEQNSLLGHMLLQMQHTLADSPKSSKIIQELVALRTKVKTKYNQALKMVSETARGKVPTKFKKGVTRILTFLQKKFANHYEQDFPPRFLVTMQGENIWNVAYLLFKGLQDDTGFRHDRYFIIITQVITPKGQEEYHSTISSNLRLPGNYSFDVTAHTLDQLLKLINDQIAVDRMISRNKVSGTSDRPTIYKS